MASRCAVLAAAAAAAAVSDSRTTAMSDLSSQGGASPTARPNIVWIMSDDLGYGEVSRMPGRSNTNISTPHIDALLASGLTFTDAYAGEAVCAPSRSSFMTGRHTGHATIRGNRAVDGHDLPLPANETTWLSVLRDSGYHVACVGKWGLGWWNTTGAPHVHGCSEYYGVLDQNAAHNMYPSDGDSTLRYPAANGSLVYEPLPFPANVGASRSRCMAPGNTCVWSHDLWTAQALAVLDAQAARQAAAARAGVAAAPFVLYLAYTDPHAGGWSGIEEQGNPVPSDGRFANETGWPENERDHASAIETFQDADVGVLVAALQAHGLRDNTLVAFASDNGASNEGGHDYAFFGSSGPLRGFKRCLTEGGIRTPLGISWPAVVAPGATTNYTFAFWDVLPTLLDAAQVPPAQWPAALDGISVLPLLEGRSQVQHPPLYWEFCTSVHPPGVTRTDKGWGQAVRSGDWKLVSVCVGGGGGGSPRMPDGAAAALSHATHSSAPTRACSPPPPPAPQVRFFEGSPWELYNLADDIGETTDVATKHAAVVTQLAAVAAASHVESALFPSGSACIGS